MISNLNVTEATGISLTKIVKKLIIHLLLVGITALTYAQTYQYDQAGRLIADTSEEIADIQWNNQSKIVKLTRTAGSIRPDLEFAYDAGGNRMVKIVKPRTASGVSPEHQWKYTYYKYDAGGSLITIMEKRFESLGGNEYRARMEVISNALVFGDRIGMFEGREILSFQRFTADIGADGRFTNVEDRGVLVPPVNNLMTEDTQRGLKQYELTNHLADVTVVVNDRRLHSETLIASVRQATDYYAYGMTMPGRKTREGANYRYGFGGAERDDEVRADDGSYDFPGRSIYDARLARFVSIDPKWRSAASVSPYAYALDNPVFFSDKSGEQAGPYEWYVRMNSGARQLQGFADKLKKERLDAFKTKGLINENTSKERAFMYGVIDQSIEELKVLDPVEWGETVMGLYELANAIAAGDISAEDAYNSIVGSVKGMKDYIASSVDPDDKDFYYNNGRNAVVAVSVIVAITKIRSASKGAREIVQLTGCFVGDTEILTAGNRFVHIRDISTEEEVYRLSDEEIRLLEEEKEALEYMVEIKLDDSEFVVLEDQLFIVNDEWKKAIDLQPGDKLLKLDGTTVEIMEVKKIRRKDVLLEANAHRSEK